MAYIGIPPFGQTVRTVTSITAISSQTIFTPTGGYLVGYIDVYYNGVKLVDGDDFTATNGTTITLTVAATAGDIVELVVYMPVSLADTYRMAEADSRFVNLTGDTMTGGLYTNSAPSSITFNTINSQYFPNVFKRGATETQRVAAFIGTGNSSCWWADDTSGTPIAVGAVDGRAASAGGGITLWGNNASLWSQGVSVNGDGTVNMPNKPIISGQVGTALTTFSAPQLIPFNEFWVSRGITYNSSTRRFTVSTSGVYRITMNPFKNSDSGSATRVLIGINTDTPQVNTHYGHTYTNVAGYNTMNLNSVVSLSSNDYIVFRLFDGTLYNQNSDKFNQFTIEMIA